MSAGDGGAGTGAEKGLRRPRIARVLLVDGAGEGSARDRARMLKVQVAEELKVHTDYLAEGRRLAEWLYWNTPWRFFEGLQRRLNELKPPDTDQRGGALTH